MNQTLLRMYIHDHLRLNLLPSQCSEAITKALCVHYFLPCGNSSSIIQVPQFLCADTCQYVADDLCSNIWEKLKDRVRFPMFNNVGYDLPACDNTSMIIAPLNLPNDCCSSGGVTIPEAETTTSKHSKSDNPPLPTQTPTGNNSNIICASVGGGIAVLVVATVLLFLVALLLFWRKKRGHTRDLRLV